MIDKEIENKMKKLDKLLKESDTGKIYTRKELMNRDCFDSPSEIKAFFIKVKEYYVSPIAWVYDSEKIEANIAEAEAKKIR